MNIHIGQAIHELAPNCKFILRGYEYSGLEWYDDEALKPTEAAVLTKAEEIAARYPLMLLREERNKRLSVTDWWVLPDRTATAEQLAYRQALRDITNTYSSLDDVVWPTKPE